MNCQANEILRNERSSNTEHAQLFVIEEPIEATGSASAYRCCDQGGLHESRIDTTKKVHVFDIANNGVYLGKNFGCSPHYNILHDEYRSFSEEATSKGIPIKRYSPKNNHELNAISVHNFISSDLKDIKNETDTEILAQWKHIDFISIYKQLKKKRECTLPKTKGKLAVDKLRGATQIHFGFAGNHSLSRGEDGHAKPVQVNKENLDDSVKTIFAVMTKLADMTYNCRKRTIPEFCKLEAVFSDGGHHQLLSKEIHPENRLDALTFSLSGSNNLLQIHCDHLNDDTKLGKEGGYNYVVLAWRVFIGQDGVEEKVSVVGYSRRSISDMIRRRSNVDCLYNEQIGPWISRQGSWRTNVNVSKEIFHPSYFPKGCVRVEPTTGTMGFLPIFNKQAGLLSAYADAIIQLREKYPCLFHSIHKTSEIFLCICFCNTAQNFRRVIVQNWVKKGTCPTKTNLVVAMLEMVSADRNIGSLNMGFFTRHQPTFNLPAVTYEWISGALKIVKRVVLLSRGMKSTTYKSSAAMLQKIKGVGPLIAQHMLHVMSMVGTIPPKFASDAVVCESTSTYKRLEHRHFLSKGRIPTMISIISKKQHCEGYVSENIICKWANEEKGGIDKETDKDMSSSLYHDCIYPDQGLIIYCTRDTKAVPRMNVVYRKKNNHNASEVQSQYMTYDETRWTHKLSTSVSNDKCVSSDDIWVNSGNLAHRCVFTTYKAKNAEKVHTKNSTNAPRGSAKIRKRLAFQQTRWGTLLSSDPTQGRSHWMSRKRLKTNGEKLLFNDSTSFWKQVDCAMMRKEELEFIKSEKEIKDAKYGKSGGHHLRELHKDGRLKVQKQRKDSAHSYQSIPSTTVLLTHGILQIQFDLHHAAALSLARSEINVGRDGIGGILYNGKIEDGFFAMLKSTGAGGLPTKDLILCVSHWYKSLTKGRLVTAKGCNNPNQAIRYSTKKQARTAFLWYLCCNCGRPELWITSLIREDEWTFLNAEHLCGKGYILLQVGGCNAKEPRGLEFATLCLSNHGVDVRLGCRFTDGNSSSTINPSFCLMDTNPYKMNLEHRRKPTRRKLDRKDVGFDTRQEVTVFKQSSNVKIIDEVRNLVCNRQVIKELLQSRKRKGTITRVWIDTPLLGQPGFTSKNFAEKNKVEILNKWRCLWSDRLDDWICYVVLRTDAGCGFTDRYWVPPYAKLRQVLRSTREVYRYIQIGIWLQEMGKISTTSTEEDYNILNDCWFCITKRK